MCTSGFSGLNAFGDIANPQINPLPSTTSGFPSPLIEPAVDSTTPASPTPLACSTSGFSNGTGQSVQPAVDSTTPASPIAATTVLPIGDAGFTIEKVGSSALGSTSSQPTPLTSSTSGFSNDAGPTIQPAVVPTTSASPFAASTPFGPSTQPPVGSTTPANPFAASTPFGSSIQPATGTTTPASPFAATTPLLHSFWGGGFGSSPFGFGTPSQPSSFRSSSSFSFSTTTSPSVQPAVGSVIPNQFSPPAGFTPSTSVFRDCEPQWTLAGDPFRTQSTQTNPPMLLSISAMPVYDDKSHEELRWIDYQVRDKGNSDFGSAPTQPLSWGDFKSSIFGSPFLPASGIFGVRASAAPVSGSSAFQSALPYAGPHWGSRVASYTPTVELDHAPHYPRLGGGGQINVPKVDKFKSEGNQLDASSSTHCPAELPDEQNNEQMDKKKMQDLRKVVELESEVERCVPVNVPKVDKVESKGKQLDPSSSTHFPAKPHDKDGEQMDKKKMQDLRKAVELECEVERRVSVKHMAFLTSMLEKLDSLGI